MINKFSFVKTLCVLGTLFLAIPVLAVGFSDVPTGVTPDNCPAGVPGCNTPINVSEITQGKKGDFIVGDLAAPQVAPLSGGSLPVGATNAYRYTLLINGQEVQLSSESSITVRGTNNTILVSGPSNVFAPNGYITSVRIYRRSSVDGVWRIMNEYTAPYNNGFRDISVNSGTVVSSLPNLASLTFPTLGNLTVNGRLKLPLGAASGKVLMSNADGLATWQTSSSGTGDFWEKVGTKIKNIQSKSDGVVIEGYGVGEPILRVGSTVVGSRYGGLIGINGKGAEFTSDYPGGQGVMGVVTNNGRNAYGPSAAVRGQAENLPGAYAGLFDGIVGVGSAGVPKITFSQSDTTNGAWIRNDGLHTVFSTNVGNIYLGFSGNLAKTIHIGNTNPGGVQIAGSAPSGSLVVSNLGNVGIGKTNPGTKLDLSGSLRLSNLAVGNVPAVNKILASTDASGIAVWKTLQEICPTCGGPVSITGTAGRIAMFNSAGTGLVDSPILNWYDKRLRTDSELDVQGFLYVGRSNLSDGDDLVFRSSASTYSIDNYGGKFRIFTNGSEKLTLDPLGNIKISAGNPGPDKVLTSKDNDGNAEWRNLSELIKNKVVTTNSSTKLSTNRWFNVIADCPSSGSVLMSCSSFLSDCEESDCGNHGTKPITHNGKPACEGWFDADGKNTATVYAVCMQ